MLIEDFHSSIKEEQPPGELSPILLALWYDGKGNWDKAHSIVDGMPGINGAWIHAYLHRKEGDLWNANYWYNRAGKTMPDEALDSEWSKLVSHFLTP